MNITNLSITGSKTGSYFNNLRSGDLAFALYPFPEGILVATAYWELVSPASANWSEVKVTFTGPTSTGDYNHNGIVDAADYTVWRASLGSTTDLVADGNGNNTVDADDYNVWKAHFGESNSGGGSTAAIPEPATLSLTMIACFVPICGALRIATK